jgi:hypothetical protein
MSTYSRYSKGGTVENIKKPGFWVRTVFPKSADDLIMTIQKKYVKKPYLLAFDIYGRQELGWFVLQYNDMIDPTTEFVEGVRIQLPTPKKVSMGMV